MGSVERAAGSPADPRQAALPALPGRERERRRTPALASAGGYARRPGSVGVSAHPATGPTLKFIVDSSPSSGSVPSISLVAIRMTWPALPITVGPGASGLEVRSAF